VQGLHPWAPARQSAVISGLRGSVSCGCGSLFQVTKSVWIPSDLLGALLITWCLLPLSPCSRTGRLLNPSQYWHWQDLAKLEISGSDIFVWCRSAWAGGVRKMSDCYDCKIYCELAIWSLATNWHLQFISVSGLPGPPLADCSIPRAPNESARLGSGAARSHDLAVKCCWEQYWVGDSMYWCHS
jgi:hypothetical protein